jgi:plastocyanin
MLSSGRLFLAALWVGIVGREAGAQTVLDRTPNLPGGWIGASGVLHFNFLHRFSISSAPERKVTSTPTFLLAGGLPARSLLGVHYASNSELSARYPNEWEFFGRIAPLQQERNAPLNASVQVGYNLAARGLDGEAAVARRQGPVRVLAAFRVLADPQESGADVALASGMVVRLTRHLALSADLASLTDRATGEKIAWGVGLNLAIPRTPHTLSLHATNTNNATLQSSSRGTRETRYGFEFTIPLTLSRYFGGASPEPEAATPPERADEQSPDSTGVGDTVVAAVQDFLFEPRRLEIAVGTTITWSNNGQVVHTVSGENGEFDSGPIEPGGRRSITFSRPGSFPFRCTPHPFMRGVIVVR